MRLVREMQIFFPAALRRTFISQRIVARDITNSAGLDLTITRFALLFVHAAILHRRIANSVAKVFERKINGLLAYAVGAFPG